MRVLQELAKEDIFSLTSRFRAYIDRNTASFFAGYPYRWEDLSDLEKMSFMMAVYTKFLAEMERDSSTPPYIAR